MNARLRPGELARSPTGAAPGAATPGVPSIEDLLKRLLPAPSPNAEPEPLSNARLSEMLRQDYAPEPPVPVYPPMRGVGYRIPIIPEPEPDLRPLSERIGLSSPPPPPPTDMLGALADAWYRGFPPGMPAPRAEGEAPPPSRALPAPRAKGQASPTGVDAGAFDLVEADEAASRPGTIAAQRGILVHDPQTGSRHALSDDAVSGFATLADDLSAVPEDAPDELVEELGKAVVSLLPGVGEALSAKEAYDATRAALAALDDDRLGEAALQGGAAAIAVFGAIPGIGGAVRLTKSAAKALPLLYKLLRRSKESAAIAGRSASREWFGRWSDNLLSGKTLPQGKMARVDTLSEETARFLREKGVALESQSINIVDRSMLRMVRELKTGKGIDVPKELLRDMPSTFRTREAVLWDKKKQNLVYVFAIPDDPKKGKFIVEIGVVRQVNRGDKTAGQAGNFVTSGGRVPAEALRDLKTYDSVEGQVSR